MAEKPPASSPAKEKGNKFFRGARVEVGSLAAGGGAAGLGALLLKAWGAMSGGLLLGAAIAAIAGYSFFKKAHE
jgi:hypothetical protein